MFHLYAPQDVHSLCGGREILECLELLAIDTADALRRTTDACDPAAIAHDLMYVRVVDWNRTEQHARACECVPFASFGALRTFPQQRSADCRA